MRAERPRRHRRRKDGTLMTTSPSPRPPLIEDASTFRRPKVIRFLTLNLPAIHRNADTAEWLDALGERIHHVALLLEVLVEQKVQLVEARSGYLPVMLLVHVRQRLRVRQHLVEIVDAGRANRGVERDRESRNRPEMLDLLRRLKADGAHTVDDRPIRALFVQHGSVSSSVFALRFGQLSAAKPSGRSSSPVTSAAEHWQTAW